MQNSNSKEEYKEIMEQAFGWCPSNKAGSRANVLLLLTSTLGPTETSQLVSYSTSVTERKVSSRVQREKMENAANETPTHRQWIFFFSRKRGLIQVKLFKLPLSIGYT